MVNKLLVITITFLIFLFFSGSSDASGFAKIIFSPQGKIVVNNPIKVNVYIDSNVNVNAAQLKITYPIDRFSLKSIDSTTSKFTVQAEESNSPGVITIARGNVNPLKGKNLFTILTFIPLKSTSSINTLSYETNDSLVMSTDNINILTGSKVLTLKPAQKATITSKKENTGVINLFKLTVTEFFNGLFGK